VTELRKIGLAEGIGGITETPGWTQTQFWHVIAILADHEQVSFDAMRIHPLFKGDASPLMALERSGILSLVLANNRPQYIKPGKPLYRTAFKQMTQDTKQSAVMSILTSKQIISDETKKLQDYEDEIRNISSISYPGLWFSKTHPALRDRLYILANYVNQSNAVIAKYSQQSSDAKKTLKLV
jgi:hypothetical protein